jgi:hypothetical protein
MGLMGNGRAKHEPPPMPRLVPKPLGEATLPRDFDELPQRDALSDILARAEIPGGADRLKEIVAEMIQEPRGAIKHIEEEIGSLRDMLSVREQMLVEAIEEHATLSKEAVRGMGVVRNALAQIRNAFNVAMRPTPVLDQQLEATSLASHQRPGIESGGRREAR